MDRLRNSVGSDGQQQTSRGQLVPNSGKELCRHKPSLAEEVL